MGERRGDGRTSAVPIAALEREPLWNTDVRFPMMMFALLLTMLSLQSLGEVIVAHEDKLPAQLATWIANPSEFKSFQPVRIQISI